MVTTIIVSVIIETDLDYEEIPSAIMDAFEDSEYLKLIEVKGLSLQS